MTSVEGSRVQSERLSDGRLLALKAMGMFVYASRIYPASTTAQASVIALQCKDQVLQPDVLMNALLPQRDLLTRLVGIAESAHKKNGRERYVSVPDVREFVESDFPVANDLMGLTDEELTSIGESYRRMLDVQYILREKNLRREALQLLAKHGLTSKMLIEFTR